MTGKEKMAWEKLPGRKLPAGQYLYEAAAGTLIIGCGAAGLKTAVSLKHFGREDVLLVSEGLNYGTSRNTGSDKQTYYKLSLAGNAPDSVRDMAQDLFQGGCVDGTHALCEAALSVRSFYHLADIGVPFPENEYGESIGYRTDHDTRGRASSVGPYTSRMMTEALFQEAEGLDVPMWDRLQLVKIFVQEETVSGALFFCCKAVTEIPCFVLIRCRELVLATGGPAAMYRDSVYPLSQTGASGVAFEAGIRGRNLTEWQFGMASVKPRWNVSGSYMQVLPRLVSVGTDGSCPREFLMDDYDDLKLLLKHTFLKGYEWPFDAAKCAGGSSLIDLFVFEETVMKGRRVFLDYRENPAALKEPAGALLKASDAGLSAEETLPEQMKERLPEEAYSYLSQAGALAQTPVQRLRQLNEPAYQFYLTHGVDLEKEPLEIRICAQHNNGGLYVDEHWETNVKGIYAVGEAACTHGVRRPGGSALNAGQVGGYRAAEHIAYGRNRDAADACADVSAVLEAAEAFLSEIPSFSGVQVPFGDSLEKEYSDVQARMSAAGGMLRNEETLSKALLETEQDLDGFLEKHLCSSAERLYLLFRLRDMLLSQKVYLSAMLDYIRRGGGSRGSALYSAKEGNQPHPKLPGRYAFLEDHERHAGVTQEIYLNGNRVCSCWRAVRPIPDAGLFFETEWKKYRERRG